VKGQLLRRQRAISQGKEPRIRTVLEPDEKTSSRWRKVSFIPAELKIQISDCYLPWVLIWCETELGTLQVVRRWEIERRVPWRVVTMLAL
jgi:hypothetical protein